MKLVREVVHIEERPSKESIAWLAARRKSALENHMMYLRQQSSTKQNSRQEHFKIGQPSTSKAIFFNNNVNEETNMEIAQAEDEIIMELEIVTENIPVECDADDFLEERVNGSTIRKKRVTKKTAAGDITRAFFMGGRSGRAPRAADFFSGSLSNDLRCSPKNISPAQQCKTRIKQNQNFKKGVYYNKRLTLFQKLLLIYICIVINPKL
ncbi:hypothetical protein JTE90_022846 [Oedothorax gibbosus]|uniref:Uncharacterized protein n=1 Tax=Oedothorax gibbosus TaxID=931172 RepID=A0AAV6U3C4_9ARAC|nr:hypothetical protein JTE90_022846 [Oedothorax gibbosus]